MAEIPFADYNKDDDDGLNNDFFNNDDDEFGFDDVDTHETIIPIDKIEQYILSENSYTRQLVASGLLDVLRNANDAKERAVVIDALSKLAQDEEPTVRTEIIDHIPHIADFCVTRCSELEGLTQALSDAILPSLVRCLHDGDNQVRKTSQSALIILLENQMIDQVDIEELICPVLMDLFLPETIPEEYRTEAVSLMVRISPLVNRGVVEKLFLPKFCELCSESMFHIRKICATSMGEMCRVVGPDLSEQKLLPKFFNLCEDGIWGVRKACTECFMEVSNCLSPNARRSELAQLFVGLLCDQSRWVRMSAFQALGPFISTFANPNSTGLYFDEDGILRVQPGEENSSKDAVNMTASESTQPTDKVKSPHNSGEANVDKGPIEKKSSDGERVALLEPTKQLMMDVSETSCSNEQLIANPTVSFEEVRWKQYSENTELVYVPGEAEKSKLVGDDFGSFKYWREPVPTLDLASIMNEVSQVTGGSCSPNTTPPATSDPPLSSDEHLEALATSLQAGITINTTSTAHPATSTSAADSTLIPYVFGSGSSPHTSTVPTYASVLAKSSMASRRHRNQSNESSGAESISSLSELMAKQQDVIPHLLLENYLSMTDPSRAQTVDSDIAQHCAYSLPAVAYTLGKENWRCLRSLYETLVSDMQWKVRRTLAFSIHELAVILGAELTLSDLVPIFDGFIKDLDEVRIGVLSHLADFLKLLDSEARKAYLPRLGEFMETDNSRVWRTRLDLAQQLTKMCELYDCSAVVKYILPLALRLLVDRVADVRQATLPLVSAIMSLLKHSSNDQNRLMLINDLIEKLALSTKWHFRQTYVQVCHRILKDQALTNEQFCKELLPSILTLSVDKIPNVRLAVAQLITQSLTNTEYFMASQNPHRDDLLQSAESLKSDPDRDVRYFAGAQHFDGASHNLHVTKEASKGQENAGHS